MYYLDEELSLHEANEHTVFRVFGGDSTLEGGYVTPDRPVNPIQAREDLALSQHDWTDKEGNPIRNMASEVAECTIYTDDEGRIIDTMTGQQTDYSLEFSVVDPTSDQSGGGMEYHLEGDFDHMVEVNSVETLQHQSTDGWQQYLEAEAGTTSDECVEVNTLSVDELIADEEHSLQATDVDCIMDDQWGTSDDVGNEGRDKNDEWWTGDDDINDTTYESESVDALIEDTLYENQAEDVKDEQNMLEDNFTEYQKDNTY